MKKTTILMAAGAALALAAAGPASATTTHCQSQGTAYGNVTASGGATCKTAAKVIKADLAGKKYGNYKCTSKRNPAGATVTCKDGMKKVRFQIAD